uniref:Uncharacterized protein n=1 Tax=Panagrellus redivivus TaxID=6233 RepID=A0A7E4ZXG6_PANRE
MKSNFDVVCGEIKDGQRHYDFQGICPSECDSDKATKVVSGSAPVRRVSISDDILLIRVWWNSIVAAIIAFGCYILSLCNYKKNVMERQRSTGFKVRSRLRNELDSDFWEQCFENYCIPITPPFSSSDTRKLPNMPKISRNWSSLKLPSSTPMPQALTEKRLEPQAAIPWELPEFPDISPILPVKHDSFLDSCFNDTPKCVSCATKHLPEK